MVPRYRKSCSWHKNEVSLGIIHVNEPLCGPPKSNINELNPNLFLSPDLGDPNQKEMMSDLEGKLKSFILMANVLGRMMALTINKKIH